MAKLTPGERKVLVKVAVGKTNAEIGREMGLRESTVKNYVNRLLRKLHCRNRVELAITAILGGIPLEETMDMVCRI